MRGASHGERDRVLAGERLLMVDGVPLGTTHATVWSEVEMPLSKERATVAAQRLATGFRSGSRSPTFERVATVVLPSRCVVEPVQAPPALTTSHGADTSVIATQDSLGDMATISALDATLAQRAPDKAVHIGRGR